VAQGVPVSPFDPGALRGVLVSGRVADEDALVASGGPARLIREDELAPGVEFPNLLENFQRFTVERETVRLLALHLRHADPRSGAHDFHLTRLSVHRSNAVVRMRICTSRLI